MVLLVAGALGTLLPILPGFPLVIAGMAVLGPDHPWSRALADRLRRWRARARKERT
jgi:uncharacterized protein YqgC (DUF456 family)